MVQKRLLLCAVWFSAWIAQPVSAEALADLSATLDAPAFLARGEPINLTLRVKNAGPEESTVVSVWLELDTRLTITSIAISGGASSPPPDALATCLSTNNRLSCQLPGLPSGLFYTFTIVTSAITAPGSFSHIAGVQGNGTDLGLGNNSTSAVTTVSDVSQSIGFTESSSGGGGGNISLGMLAALLLLSLLRAKLGVRVEQP